MKRSRQCYDLYFLLIRAKNGIKNHNFFEAALRCTNLLFPPYISRLRSAQKLQQEKTKTNQSEVKVFEPKKSLLTLRRTAKIILRKASQQSESDKTIISLLKQQHPQLDTAIELIQKFADLVRNHQPEELEEWYEQATSCEIKALKSFARGIKEDWDAVKNGMTYQWSNGQVEGQVNRLKMLKRQMYGRASHELLKKRFLCPV